MPTERNYIEQLSWRVTFNHKTSCFDVGLYEKRREDGLWPHFATISIHKLDVYDSEQYSIACFTDTPHATEWAAKELALEIIREEWPAYADLV